MAPGRALLLAPARCRLLLAALLQFATRLALMREGGVPPARLEALGLGPEHERLAYGDVLRSLPEELGVQLEFWRSAPGAERVAAARGLRPTTLSPRWSCHPPCPGLYTMARQYRILRHNPAAMQARAWRLAERRLS